MANRMRLGLGLALCALPSLAAAQVVTAVGSEFQVNTFTSSDQFDPAICNGPSGDFVVVFDSRHLDGNYFGIFGQRYASNGDRLGTEFQVNTYTTGFQTDPAICCDASGNFTVVWDDFRDQDSIARTDVSGQRFASNGTFIGSEFQVNTYTSGDQRDSRICCAADGAFTVVWEEANGEDGDVDGIFGQRFASSGARQGTEFQATTYTSDDQSDPAICCDALGNFVVSWESEEQDGSVFEEDGIFAQRFAVGGQRVGTEFQVNTYTFGGQYDPEMCCEPNGNFVIVWWGYGDQDGDGGGIFGQRFLSDGELRGREFQVNTHTQGDQTHSDLCCDLGGEFVVAWQSDFDQDGDREGVFGRRFGSNGFPTSGEFQVNTYTSGYQGYPAITCNGPDAFVVVWDSGSNHDGQLFGVFGQRFGPSAIQSTPAMSFAGLGLAVIAIVGAGMAALRRKKN